MCISSDSPGWSGRFKIEKFGKPSSRENDDAEEVCDLQRITEDKESRGSSAKIASIFKKKLKHSSLHSAYEERRAVYLAAERVGSWCQSATRSASHEEREAAEIVRRIREDERDVLFGNKPGETIPGPDTLDMGGQLLSNHARIERSELFRIAKEMPKGCQLHIHFNTEIEIKEIIQRSRDLDTMYVKSTKALIGPRDYDQCEIIFKILPALTDSVSIFAKEYDELLSSGDTNVWMRWKEFCKVFKEHREETAEDWLSTKIALGEEEVYGLDQTLNGYKLALSHSFHCRC